MRNTKVIRLAAVRSLSLSYRVPKKSGMVLLERCWVMIRVRRPRMSQASSDPMKAFPRPIQVEARPKFQPNWPA